MNKTRRVFGEVNDLANCCTLGEVGNFCTGDYPLSPLRSMLKDSDKLAFIATTVAIQKEEARELKRLGFKPAGSYEGRGGTVTLWFRAGRPR